MQSILLSLKQSMKEFLSPLAVFFRYYFEIYKLIHRQLKHYVRLVIHMASNLQVSRA